MREGGRKDAYNTPSHDSHIKPSLTIPIKVMKMMTANEKKATNAFALMSGCRFCNTLTRKSPPSINMNAVSRNAERGGGRGGREMRREGRGGEGREE